MNNKQEILVGSFLLAVTLVAALTGAGTVETGVVMASVLAMGLAAVWLVALFGALAAVGDLFLYGSGATAAARALAAALLLTLALLGTVALAVSGAGLWAGPLAAVGMIIHGIYRRDKSSVMAGQG